MSNALWTSTHSYDDQDIVDLTRNDQLITGAGGYHTLPHFADDSLAPPFFDSSVNQESVDFENRKSAGTDNE